MYIYYIYIYTLYIFINIQIRIAFYIIRWDRCPNSAFTPYLKGCWNDSGKSIVNSKRLGFTNFIKLQDVRDGLGKL